MSSDLSDKRTAGATYCCTLSQCLHAHLQIFLKLIARFPLIFVHKTFYNLNLSKKIRFQTNSVNKAKTSPLTVESSHPA